MSISSIILGGPAGTHWTVTRLYPRPMVFNSTLSVAVASLSIVRATAIRPFARSRPRPSRGWRSRRVRRHRRARIAPLRSAPARTDVIGRPFKSRRRVSPRYVNVKRRVSARSPPRTYIHTCTVQSLLSFEFLYYLRVLAAAIRSDARAKGKDRLARLAYVFVFLITIISFVKYFTN